MSDEVTEAPIVEGSESLEALEEKLSALKEQYTIAEEALKEEPDNEELKTLKASLLEVIALTENLIKMKKPKPSVLGVRKAETFETPQPKETEEEADVDYAEGEEGEEKYVIPKHLKILPDDPEDVRQKKRKKQRAIKSAFWKKKVEQERHNTTNSWKEFTAKRPKIGGTAFSAPKKSIFATPDTLDGRVGVVGSGKGMTPANTYKPLDEVKKKVYIPSHTRLSSRKH